MKLCDYIIVPLELPDYLGRYITLNAIHLTRVKWDVLCHEISSLKFYGVIYEVGCVLTFYNGLIIEARYTSVLKICEHKRCHVNQFSAAKSK